VIILALTANLQILINLEQLLKELQPSKVTLSLSILTKKFRHGNRTSITKKHQNNFKLSLRKQNLS